MKLTTKNLKVPTKEVQVTILNQEMSITIYPICGFGFLKLKNFIDAIKEDKKAIQGQEELTKFVLKNGAKAEDEDIQFMLDNDIFACFKLVQEILDFSSEINELKSKETEVAKKNQKK